MSRYRQIAERQGLHVISLMILVTGLVFAHGHEEMQGGVLWGVTTSQWFWCAIVLAVLHQVYVMSCRS